MPAISKIRLTNIIYENGGKRYNDQLFHFDGQNSALLLENGGGKTVFIQTVLQCIIPHISMADRKIKDTLHLEQGPAHIAIEWIMNEQPRRYALTCVSLFTENSQLNSLKYTYEYSGNDDHTIDDLPFKVEVIKDGYRPATRGEISEYYQRMAKTNPYSKVFNSITDYGKYLESQFKIIPSEWRKVAVINSGEGNVDEYFNRCKTTEQLLNNLLIPVVEEAIEGENSAEFAKTFEKQRDHFKKNRILHDKIEQSKGVKEQIDAYVDIYKRYDAKLSEVRKIKGRARKVTELMEDKLAGVESGRNQIEMEKSELEGQEKVLANQKLTFQILTTDNKMESKAKEIEALENRLGSVRERLDKSASRRQNIQITKIKNSCEELDNELRRLEIELENEEKNLPTGDLKVQLAENSANIKGHFEYELEKIKVEKGTRTDAIDQMDLDLHRLEQDKGLVETKELTAKEQVIKTQTAIEFSKKEMDDIYDTLFESSLGNSVDDFLSKWTYDFENLNQELIRMGNDKLDMIANLSGYEKDITRIQDQMEKDHKDLEVLKADIGSMDKAAKALLEKVNDQGIKLSTKDSIYTKEESMKTLLKEKAAYYEEKRSGLLNDELTLMTKGMMKDVVHPSLIEVFKKLKDEVEYLSLGQEYLYQLADSSEDSTKELLEKYPFFAMTFITNRVSKPKVLDQLVKHNQQLIVPVFVMTIEDVAKLVKQDEEVTDESLFMDNAVIPSLWNDALTEGYLDSHNETIESELEEVRTERSANDTKWSVIDHLIREVDLFFDDNSYDSYQRKEMDAVALEKDIQELELQLTDIQKLSAELDEQYHEVLEEEAKKSAVKEELKGKIDLATHHEETYSRYLSLREEEEKIQEEVGNLIYQRKELQYTIAQLKMDRNKVVESLKEFDFEMRKITDHPLYEEVKDADTIAANKDFKLLVNEREALVKKLAGLSVSRESIVLRMDEQSKLQSHYKTQLNRLTKEAAYEIQTIDTFYDTEEDDLFDEIVGLKHDVKELESELKKEEKARWAFETEKNLLTNDLKMNGGELYDFDCDLAYIPTRIKVHEATVKDIKRKIDRDEKEFGSKLSRYNNLITQLRIKDGTYNFLGEDAGRLTKKDKERLETNPDILINELFKELASHSGVLKALHFDVSQSKENVVNHCRDHVDDFRLKEAIVNGLMEKSDYNELLIYQERMTDIINRTIQLANDDKRESDTELMTFLSHLLTYVKTVISELSILQKKTVIDLAEASKQIFVFDIPEYEDDTAKEMLRLYIDEMIELFEEEKELDEESIRRLIEERLSVKNLIGVVLNHVPIKVKCRKVTNDLKINKAPMSWEHSNKWSGGEKWSKNMTLFLGILNYLAEKKQHLSANQRQNRTVILDNPFGKASSKHVLDPVFFIAERLGFQILALTAHAEGQFISDYFPVVYSLRLRDTNQDNKLLMTTERVLNYTYLKEKAPASITRLQEAQQLDLFQV